MRIQATLLMFLSMLAICHAQLKVGLQFESAAPREVFVAKALPQTPPADAVKAAGASLDYPLPAFAEGDRIYVWDRSTNNIASKPIKDIAANWAPKAADFNLIGLVTVHVEHKGKPVQAARVKITTKAKSEEKLLDPTGNGDVQFFGYPAGDFRVKVAYNTVEKKEGSTEQIFPLATKRDKPEPILTVAVSDEVATVAESAAPTNAPGAAAGNTPTVKLKDGEQPPAAESGLGAKLILMAIAILAIVGVAYWVFNLAKKDPKVFEEKLQKLGVQVPTQQDPDANAPIPVTPLPPPAPAPKIMLDDAAPTPLAAAPAVTSATAMAGEPAIVSETGSRISLAEGENLIGREDGLPVSLAGESTVSRRHAAIVRTGGAAILKDLGSTNGTFVNGTRLQGETTLRPGDQLQFGSVRFRYEG